MPLVCLVHAEFAQKKLSDISESKFRSVSIETNEKKKKSHSRLLQFCQFAIRKQQFTFAAISQEGGGE